jgi:erythromycin esterase-like protein
MSTPRVGHTTLTDWIAREALRCSIDVPAALHAAVDQLIGALDATVELLGFGEALHGGAEILQLRNRLFQRLAEAHGYSAIAVESSFPRGRLVNEYVAGRGPASYDAIQEAGFSHGFGRLEANRELVEWMRQYNADSAQHVKLRFYGFDSPTEMYATDSPSHVLHFALDYLAAVDRVSGQTRRDRVDALLGSDADWENPAALMDPAKSIGQSAAASALRIETEDLITELRIRRPELIASGGADRYWEALQHTIVARQLLSYHAGLARSSNNRISELLGIRDAIMADNLDHIVARERGRGKVLAFAHNQHLQRGKLEWQLGPHRNTWWPAGAHLDELFGPRYVAIGSGVGVSEANGIGQPEPGTLEALLAGSPGSALFIPTHRGQGLPGSEIAALPTRSGSPKNSTYFVLTPAAFADFDWLAILASSTYARGGPPLP